MLRRTIFLVSLLNNVILLWLVWEIPSWNWRTLLGKCWNLQLRRTHIPGKFPESCFVGFVFFSRESINEVLLAEFGFKLLKFAFQGKPISCKSSLILFANSRWQKNDFFFLFYTKLDLPSLEEKPIFHVSVFNYNLRFKGVCSWVTDKFLYAWLWRFYWDWGYWNGHSRKTCLPSMFSRHCQQIRFWRGRISDKDMVFFILLINLGTFECYFSVNLADCYWKFHFEGNPYLKSVSSSYVVCVLNSILIC